MARGAYQENFMNKYIKSAVALALVCRAPLLQAQVLGGNAGGALGGGLGGSLGGGMGSLGGMGNGSANGALSGSLYHGDLIRRTGTRSVERTRDVAGNVGQRTRDVTTRAGERVRDGVSSTRDAAQG